MSATYSHSTLGTFTLPPQTTPFAPSATALAAGCNPRSRSVFCFTTAGQLIPGYACDLVDRIDVNSYEYLNNNCYPPHYDLINQLGTDDRTLAWPGTACPAGYTPACTTTITLSNPSAKPTPYTGTLTQTWCCPAAANSNDGAWVCTDRDQLVPTSRLCLSLAAPSSAKRIWFSADPALAATARSGGNPAYTTSAVGPQMSIRVIRAAFPLGEVRQEVVDGMAGLSATVTANTTAAPVDDGSSGGGTNPGIVAGIVIGCLALLGFVATGIYLCLRYKKEGKEEKEEERVEIEKVDHGLIVDTSLDEKEKDVKEIVDNFAVGELPASMKFQPPPQGRFTEMGSESGAAELPTEYNAGPGGRDPGGGAQWL
ncbi:hypothetical protein QBC34DRAFT_463614 [Podospora aff. communis PSN243]|uniref:Uncharacterized protein n=1 Tax=Podospora aff. communis PSN243 TaxID=3040156 RepID=A0AAV9GM61_9PEZI|nr:hypothetical protein QBC34DRAFT_463614 [Podospora aff. communis PSN243]